MSEAPTVSVVIPVLNGEATIGDTLAALIGQSGGLNGTEVLVVDNGSTDATQAIVRKFAVKLLHERRRGPAAARNRGLQAARGAVVAHLDADILPTRRWLSEIVAPFADQNVVQVAGRMIAYRPSTPAQRYYARYFLDHEAENASATGFPFAASGNMAFRRAAALDVGGWDEGFMVAQDVDLSYRLLRRFHNPIHYQANALVLSRVHPSLAQLQKRAFKYGQGRARLWLQYRAEAPPIWWAVARSRTALAILRAWPYVIRTARRANYATDADVDDANSYAAWQRAFWRGFINMIRQRDWCLEN